MKKLIKLMTVSFAAVFLLSASAAAVYADETAGQETELIVSEEQAPEAAAEDEQAVDIPDTEIDTNAALPDDGDEIAGGEEAGDSSETEDETNSTLPDDGDEIAGGEEAGDSSESGIDANAPQSINGAEITVSEASEPLPKKSEEADDESPDGEDQDPDEPDLPDGTVYTGDDGLIYVISDGEATLYSGYYMDAAGLFCKVESGESTPAKGTKEADTSYYSYNDEKYMTLSKQIVFVDGKPYTGYYTCSKGTFYTVKNGSRTKKSGTLEAGISYYSYNDGKEVTLSKQTVFVNGKPYTGYYTCSAGVMYKVTSGTRSKKTGSLEAGTNYYCYNDRDYATLSKPTVYVDGKLYTGYYTCSKGTFYTVKDGSRTKKSGTLEAGISYYSYNDGKEVTLSKQTVFVDGKPYTGYYTCSKGVCYTVTKGARTKYTGILEKGTEYYSYNDKATLSNDYTYYYENGATVKNTIIGSYYYDDGGVQVTDSVVMKAVAFVNAHSSSSQTAAERFQSCYNYIFVTNYNYTRFYGERPTSADLAGFADYYFTNLTANCYRHAAATAYVAKVLGYDVRVAIGLDPTPGSLMNDHGWCLVCKNGTWYINDYYVYMTTEAADPYHRSYYNKSVYTLTISNGTVSWG